MFILNALMNMLTSVQERFFPRFNPFGLFTEHAPTPVPVDYALAGTYAGVLALIAVCAFTWMRIRAGTKSGRGSGARPRTHREGHASKSAEAKEKDEKVKCGTGSHKLNIPVKDKENSAVDITKYDERKELDEKCKHQRESFASK